MSYAAARANHEARKRAPAQVGERVWFSRVSSGFGKRDGEGTLTHVWVSAFGDCWEIEVGENDHVVLFPSEGDVMGAKD